MLRPSQRSIVESISMKRPPRSQLSIDFSPGPREREGAESGMAGAARMREAVELPDNT